LFYYLSKALPPLVYPLGLAAILLLVAVFLLWRSRRWATAVLVLALALLWLGGNRIVMMAVVSSLEWRYTPPAELPQLDVIVVLGGGSQSPAPPRSTAEFGDAGDRMLYAAYLHQQGVAPQLILSGGGVTVDGTAVYPEANAMAELLAIMGVPPTALILEPRSRNTYENAVEVKALLAELDADRIGLVTSALHMPRSMAIFARQGIDVTPLPTDYRVTYADWNYYTQPNLAVQLYNLAPTAGNLDKLSDALKEYIGIAVYWARGWL
jgi:uncharacterized SAM-binding protein YcdF (DUF218 family)